MFRTQIILVFAIFHGTIFQLDAQKPPIQFGQIDTSDLLMTDCAFEPKAGAMVLCDYADADLFAFAEAGIFAYWEKRHKRIKILTKAGLEEANVRMVYYAGYSQKVETISQVKARCYYWENGKVITVDLVPGDVYNNDLGYGFQEIKFAVPGVREGCVIEYMYELHSQDIQNLDDWYFQNDLPVRHSEYRLFIPDFLDYQVTLHGLDSADIQSIQMKQGVMDTLSDPESAAWRPKTQWIKENVRALNPEPFMPAKADVSTHLEFQLRKVSMHGFTQDVVTSYDQINNILLHSDQFGKYLEPERFEQKMVRELTENLTDPKAKAQAILRHIQEKVGCTGEFSLLTDRPPSKVYSKGSGSITEINLLAVACLRAAGLQADPVILGTRSHAHLHPDFPNTKKINYLLIAMDIGEHTLLSDAAAKELPLGFLPTDCLNGLGWRVSVQKPGFIGLQENALAKDILFFSVQADGDSWKGKATFKSTDYSAAESRKVIAENGKEEYIKARLQSISDWNPGTPKLSDTDEPFEVEMEVPVSQKIGTDDLIVFKPVIAGSIFENPLEAETRHWPMNFPYAANYNYVLRLTLPEGYTLAEQPANTQVEYGKDKTLMFQYRCSIEGKNLTVISKLQMRQLNFEPEEYSELRQFFDLIVRKNQEVLVLKKL